MMLFSTTLLAKPMFKIKKPLLIPKQITHAKWQNIPWQVIEYFAMSWNILSHYGIFYRVTKYFPYGNEYMNNIP